MLRHTSYKIGLEITNDLTVAGTNGIVLVHIFQFNIARGSAINSGLCSLTGLPDTNFLIVINYCKWLSNKPAIACIR